MQHLHLTDAQIALLGMPAIPPYLFGLVPLKRRHYGWAFRVEKPWLVEAMADLLLVTPVSHGASQTRRSLLVRLRG